MGLKKTWRLSGWLLVNPQDRAALATMGYLE